MNPGDFTEGLISGTNPGNLAEKMTSGTNLRDLVEEPNYGTNPGDFTEGLISGTNPRDLAEEPISDTNLGDLAEKVISGTNPRDLAEGFIYVGASSEPLSPVDSRALRDLEVMKADHDLDMVVIEGSLAVIRERYNIPVEYGLHVQ
ncbi:hypothetical protein B296_00056751 [Ensete ventricosum]|uniref:Uncharacterized protein n=1 Tax=Ensete ventricosum TaxID=4639 RepID=A0A426WZT4_ENSVE|nr:hypothetical protein B296_00056751 [Ensete ventricosum]